MTEADPNAPVREKIEAARARIAESNAARTARSVIEEHPVAAMAGGLLVGALIARAIAPRIGKERKADAVGVNDSDAGIGKRASAIAALAAEFAAAYVARATEAGREGVGKLEEIGGSVSDKIVEGSDEARRRAADITEIAINGAKGAGEVALKRLTDLASRMRR